MSVILYSSLSLCLALSVPPPSRYVLCCACVGACVRACVRACVHACVRVYVDVHVGVFVTTYTTALTRYFS